MKRQIIISFLCAYLLLTLSVCALANRQDVYIIIYATHKGKTGHAGIAIDKYKTIYRDVQRGDSAITIEEKVKTNELQYFDFWPDDDKFDKLRTSESIPGLYFKLPENLFEEITVNSLVDKGLPHKENYPCDGLLRIRTSAQEDSCLAKIIDSTIASNRLFNVRQFNCTDFVLVPLQHLLKKKIAVKEFIPFAFSSTPNRLYQRLIKMKEVEVLKNADTKTRSSFIKERVLYKIFNS